MGQEVKTTEEIFGKLKTTEDIFGGMKTTEELFGTAPLKAETPDPATVARMEATQEGVRGPKVNLPPFQQFAQDLSGGTNRIWGGVQSAMADSMGTLSKAADFISEKTGLPKGGIFKQLHERYKNEAEKVNKLGVQGIVGDVMEGLGGAAIAIPEIMQFGPLGMPIHGGLKGGVKGGVKGAVEGALTGGLIHGSLGALGKLPVVPKIMAALGFGAATTPGGAKERTTGALTWAALGMAGGHKKVTAKEFMDNYPKIRDKMTAMRIAKITKGAVKPKEVMEAGGPQVVMDELVKELTRPKEEPAPPPDKALSLEVPPEIGASKPKQPWEMTSKEFGDEYVFHGKTKASIEGNELKPGTFYAPDYDMALDWTRQSRGLGEKKVIAVRKSEIKSIPADKSDIFGDEWIKGGLATRSGSKHTGIDVPTGGHRGIIKQALEKGKVVPPEVLAEYPDLVVSKPIIPATGMEIPAPPEGRVPAGKMVYGAELPKMAGSINLERVGGDYDVKSLIRDTADIYSEAITKARRGKVTMEESAAAADALGMNVQTLVKNVKGRTENLDAHILALRDTLATSATHVIKAAKEYMADPIDNNLIKMNHYRDIHAAIQLEASRGATEIGRALNIHKKISRSKEILLTQSYEKALGALSGRKKISKHIAELMAHTDFEDPLQAAKFLREVQDVKTSDKVFELWMNNILSGAHTHVVNSVSNVGMAVDKMAMTTVAAALEAPKVLFGKKREVLFGEAPYQYAGGTGKGKIAERVLESAKRQGFEIESGLEVGIRNAAFAWSNELSARDIQGSKLDVVRPAAIKGVKGKLVRVPTRALITLDELAKGVIHQMDVWGLAYRKASHEGLKGQAKTDRIAELISRPTETMKEHAVEEMTVRTFQKELGSIGDKVMRIRNMVPGLRYLIPFVKVSINLPKEALRRSPLNIARVTYKYRAGEMKGAELAEQAALGFMGMMTAASIFKFALDGKITGDYPTDKNERDEWKRTGKQPYSIVYKVGGEKKYLSFERLEPLGTVLSLSADAAAIYKSIKEGKKFDDVAKQLVNVVIENLFDKTFMRGFYTFAKALVDPEQNLDYFVKSFTSSAIPRAVSQTARAIDPVMRDARSLIDFYKTQIPFLSKEVPAKKDIWGRDEKTGGSAVFRLMSPFYYNEDMSTSVDKELSELGITIGKPGKTGILPRTEPKREAYKMTSTEYEKMSEESGKSIYVALSNLISYEGYKSLPPMEKIKMIEGVVGSLREASKIPYRITYSGKKGQER